MLVVYFPSVSLKYKPSPLTVMELLPRGKLTFLAEQLGLPSSPRPHTRTERGQCAGVCKGWQSDARQLQEYLEDQDLGRSRSQHICLWLFSLQCTSPHSRFQPDMHGFQNREKDEQTLCWLWSALALAHPQCRDTRHVSRSLLPRSSCSYWWHISSLSLCRDLMSAGCFITLALSHL